MEIDKSVKNWKAQEVEKAFGVKRTWENAVLERWITTTVDIPERQLERLEELRSSAFYYIDSWNEAAIKFLFIGPLIQMVQFASEGKFNSFLEQTLTISNDTATARGNVDFMVATGREIAEAPFYLLHEYKPEATAVLDPKGQLLIAMLAAQKENESVGLTQPIYGTYLIGRMWFMVVLSGKEYTISQAFDCTKKQDILIIYQCLEVVKDYIEELFEELPQGI